LTAFPQDLLTETPSRTFTIPKAFSFEDATLSIGALYIVINGGADFGELNRAEPEPMRWPEERMDRNPPRLQIRFTFGKEYCFIEKIKSKAFK
jgi:hypothetical protein